MSPKTLIYCNGEPLKNQVFQHFKNLYSFFIGADGGTNSLLIHKVLPSVIIGDMDSYQAPASLQHLVQKNPDQETNDLEKALNYCLLNKITDVDITGATGFRIDHTLKNLSVMVQFENQFENLRLIDNFGVHWLAREKEVMETKPGQVISLSALSGTVAGISTEGLKYSLNNESLKVGKRDGSSNQAIGSQVVTSHKKGNLLISLQHPFL